MDDDTLVRGRRTYDRDSALGENHRLGPPGKRYAANSDLNFDAGLPSHIEKSESAVDLASEQAAPPAAPPADHPAASVPRQRPVRKSPSANPTTRSESTERGTGAQQTGALPTPKVLTWEAVKKNIMPVLGESGLPESLESDVPPEYRYWKCTSEHDATAVRNALVESGLFDGTVMDVDGEPRRVVTETLKRMWIAGPYSEHGEVVVPPEVSPIEKVAEYCDVDRDTLLIDHSHVEAFGIDSVMQTVRKFGGDWIVAARDSDANRVAMGPCFKLHFGGDGLIFATVAKVDSSAPIEHVIEDRSSTVLRDALADDREIRLIKSHEERIVFGVVLEPDTVDAQGDTIAAEEIRQAAHKFMEDFGNLGLQHKEIVNGKLKLLESFIAPVDFDVDGQAVKKGTWLMAERVIDDDLWVAIRKGEITGYSIGGSAMRHKISGGK